MKEYQIGNYFIINLLNTPFKIQIFVFNSHHYKLENDNFLMCSAR